MSSGSMSYVYYVEAATKYIEDEEIKDLILDTAKLLHDIEWFKECVNCEDRAEEAIYKFRKKWFGTTRNERIKEYIETSLEAVKQDMLKLIDDGKGDTKET